MVLVEIYEGKDNLKGIEVDGKIILKWGLKKWDRGMDLAIWSGMGTCGEHFCLRQ
jgi:hypothetical protein